MSRISQYQSRELDSFSYELETTPKAIQMQLKSSDEFDNCLGGNPFLNIENDGLEFPPRLQSHQPKSQPL